MRSRRYETTRHVILSRGRQTVRARRANSPTHLPLLQTEAAAKLEALDCEVSSVDTGPDAARLLREAITGKEGF